MLIDWSEMADGSFWLAALKIIWINILLSGDNALVLAVACRQLSPSHRVWGTLLGAAVAVLLCVIFTLAIASLLLLPYVKLVGGLLLLYIAAKLLIPPTNDTSDIPPVEHLWRAVCTVAVAQTSMSLDNVVATAAAAHGNRTIMILGLVVSIPLIVAGAALVRAMLDKFPILVWAGAALLGWIAGEVIASEPVIHRNLLAQLGSDWTHIATLSTAPLCAIIVLVVGKLWRGGRQPIGGTMKA